ncbi:hypothetical protein pb186bvf_002835 [Paramecium bursaria]
MTQSRFISQFSEHILCQLINQKLLIIVMGCKPNKKLFINSMEEVKIEEPFPQNEQIQVINQLSIHDASITKQYILFPENTLIEKDALQEQVQISQFFSFSYLPVSSIKQTLQPFSPGLTLQMLIKCMDSKQAVDQSSISKDENHEYFEHNHRGLREHDKLLRNKKKLDMKTLEAEF